MSISMRSSIVAGTLIALSASTLAFACPPDSVPARPAGDMVAKPVPSDIRGLAKYLKSRDSGSTRPAIFAADYQPPASTAPADKSNAPQPAVQTAPAPEWLTRLVPDPGSPEQKAYTQRMKTKAQQEKELKKLRATYFRASKNTEVRQVGISKLREYTDAAIFPSLITLFQGEGADAEAAVLDHLADLKSDEADATLSWAAVFGKEKPFRDAATKRLVARTKEASEVTNRVKWPISLGLRDTSNNSIVAGARLGVLVHAAEEDGRKLTGVGARQSQSSTSESERSCARSFSHKFLREIPRISAARVRFPFATASAFRMCSRSACLTATLSGRIARSSAGRCTSARAMSSGKCEISMGAPAARTTACWIACPNSRTLPRNG